MADSLFDNLLKGQNVSDSSLLEMLGVPPAQGSGVLLPEDLLPPPKPTVQKRSLASSAIAKKTPPKQEDISRAQAVDPNSIEGLFAQLSQAGAAQQQRAIADDLANRELQNEFIQNMQPNIDVSPLAAILSGFPGQEDGVLKSIQQAQSKQQTPQQQLADIKKLFPSGGVDDGSLDLIKTKLNAKIALDKIKQSKQASLKDKRSQDRLELTVRDKIRQGVAPITKRFNKALQSLGPVRAAIETGDVSRVEKIKTLLVRLGGDVGNAAKEEQRAQVEATANSVLSIMSLYFGGKSKKIPDTQKAILLDHLDQLQSTVNDTIDVELDALSDNFALEVERFPGAGDIIAKTRSRLKDSILKAGKSKPKTKAGGGTSGFDPAAFLEKTRKERASR